MIVKTSSGYQVLSEKGSRCQRITSPLSKAEQRLKQVEMFKHMKPKGKSQAGKKE